MQWCVCFTDLDPQDLHAELVAFEAFCMGRDSDGAESLQIQQHQQRSNDEFESANEQHDDLYAHMTRNKTTTKKATNPKKPSPGIINRLLGNPGKRAGE